MQPNCFILAFYASSCLPEVDHARIKYGFPAGRMIACPFPPLRNAAHVLASFKSRHALRCTAERTDTCFGRRTAFRSTVS
ncbi:hypothetical protein PLICRDRAFT_91213 [Plicaturopsis crispa FD-325 SS-3]|nr:hypothetical protein PLICRDRAFT_91213 [Plicaturopsis crispa FD-325 SS-3]